MTVLLVIDQLSNGLQLLLGIAIIAAGFAIAYLWEHPELLDGHPFDDDHTDSELCPMGCGRTTDDPYGGPCRHCWERVG